MVGTPIRGGLGGGWDNLTLFFSGMVLPSSALFSKFSLLFSVFLCIARGSWERSGMWGAGLFGLLSASIPITLDKILQFPALFVFCVFYDILFDNFVHSVRFSPDICITTGC